MSLLLTLNIVHTLFWCFRCWLWTNKCSLCVWMYVCVFFHREGFFRLQDVLDILEGTDKRSCVVNINLGASAKFFHLGIWKCHISSPKTKLQPIDNWRETIWHIRVIKRWHILIKDISRYKWRKDTEDKEVTRI